MCGIVGYIGKKNAVPILMEGLKRLEYRGYDSAGIAVLRAEQSVQRARAQGKVAILSDILERNPIEGTTGIAHTRWATHGKPSERNAHPHMALVLSRVSARLRISLAIASSIRRNSSRAVRPA